MQGRLVSPIYVLYNITVIEAVMCMGGWMQGRLVSPIYVLYNISPIILYISSHYAKLEENHKFPIGGIG